MNEMSREGGKKRKKKKRVGTDVLKQGQKIVQMR